MSSKTKMIAVSEKTWKDLTQMGTLADTFDSVIQRMINKEKVATSEQTLAGNRPDGSDRTQRPGDRCDD
jgi:hypothetical protein